MIREGKVDKAALAGALAHWFFSLNFQEGMLLFCCILLCAMGVLVQLQASERLYCKVIHCHIPQDAIHLGYPGTLLDYRFSDEAVKDVAMGAIVLAMTYTLLVVLVSLYMLVTTRKRKEEILKTRSMGKRKMQQMIDTLEPAFSSSSKDLSGTTAVANPLNAEAAKAAYQAQVNPLFTSAATSESAETPAPRPLPPAIVGRISEEVSSAMSANTPPPSAMWNIVSLSSRSRSWLGLLIRAIISRCATATRPLLLRLAG
jgi:hypothetical protein